MAADVTAVMTGIGVIWALLGALLIGVWRLRGWQMRTDARLERIEDRLGITPRYLRPAGDGRATGRRPDAGWRPGGDAGASWPAR